jgi:predicted MFS family arabinose efflux permease
LYKTGATAAWGKPKNGENESLTRGNAAADRSWPVHAHAPARVPMERHIQQSRGRMKRRVVTQMSQKQEITNGPVASSQGRLPAKTAFRFVLLLAIVSLFADFAYEGARSVTGPFLAVLGASGAVVGVVAGLGELLGYGLRLVSGTISDRTRMFWPITIFGFVVQMASIPLLALAGNWPMAALLILTERTGKAIRKPPRDVMLAAASQEIGLGFGFGLHEGIDQIGALIGPLSVAGVLYWHGDYRRAFAMLLVPAVLTLAVLVAARLLYPKPENLQTKKPVEHAGKFSRAFWVYLTGAALVAAGFADFQLIAFHFQKAEAFPNLWIPIIYSIAMAVSGAGSLIFGKLFDRFGIGVLIPLTLVSAAFAPLVFLGGFGAAIIGAGLWGLGMGVHDSIIPAAVTPMVPAERRSSAYGLFTAAYGIAWFVGSAAMGFLYDRSIPAVVIFSVALELAAIPVFARAWTISRREAVAS